MQLTAPELIAARDFLRQADMLVDGVRSLFFNIGNSAPAARLNGRLDRASCRQGSSGAAAIVAVQIPPNRGPNLHHALIGIQVDLSCSPWRPKDRATSAPREGELQRQPVDLAHEFEIGCGCRARQVIHRAARDACGFGLFRDSQRMTTVNHRLAPSNPALVSAPSKKSFSSVNSPILACKLFKATLEAAASFFSLPNDPAAPSRSWAFHWVI
jgi:hypothetical protein